MQETVSTGTTTLGFVWSEGVIVAADRRATMDTMISSKNTAKIHKVSDHIAMTIAGGLGDSQYIVKLLQAEGSIFYYKNGVEISVNGIATLLANVLNQTKFFPEYTFPIVAGVDRTGPHVYSVDPAGGAESDEFISVGSGSPYVYGVMEDKYSNGLEEAGALDLAVRALCSALKRDAATGNGIDVVTITPSDFKWWPEKEINKIASKYGVQF